MNIISECPLCDAHGLHVVGEDKDQILQCLSCGYVSSGNFTGDKKDNKFFNDLPPDMKEWTKETDTRFWIPTMITLPFGMLYPVNVKDNEDVVMKWALAKTVDISEEEKENYPMPDGGYYEKRFDTEGVIHYDLFLDAMAEVNKLAKEAKPKEVNVTPTTSNIKLPKLKRIS